RELAQDSATFDAAGGTGLAAHPAHAILAIPGRLLLAAEQPIAFEIGLTVVEVSSSRLLQRCARFLQAGCTVLARLPAHARSAVSLVGRLGFRLLAAMGCRSDCCGEQSSGCAQGNAPCANREDSMNRCHGVLLVGNLASCMEAVCAVADRWRTAGRVLWLLNRIGTRR